MQMYIIKNPLPQMKIQQQQNTECKRRELEFATSKKDTKIQRNWMYTLHKCNICHLKFKPNTACVHLHSILRYLNLLMF